MFGRDSATAASVELDPIPLKMALTGFADVSHDVGLLLTASRFKPVNFKRQVLSIIVFTDFILVTVIVYGFSFQF